VLAMTSSLAHGQGVITDSWRCSCAAVYVRVVARAPLHVLSSCPYSVSLDCGLDAGATVSSPVARCHLPSFSFWKEDWYTGRVDRWIP